MNENISYLNKILGILIALMFILYINSSTNIFSYLLELSAFSYFLFVLLGILGLVYTNINMTNCSDTIGLVTRFLFGLLLMIFIFGYYLRVSGGMDPWIDIRYVWAMTGTAGCIVFWIYNDSPQQQSKYQYRSYRKYINMIESPDMKNKYALTVAALIIIGGTLRFYRLGALSFTVDEIYTGMAIKAIQDHGYPLFPDGRLYSRGLIHTYFSWFLAQLVGINEFSTRLPAAISGTLLIPLVYFIGRDFSGERVVGVLCAGCITLFPWMVEFSRWGRFYMMASLLYLGTFYTAKKGFETRRLDIIGIAAILALLSVLNSQFGFITVVVFPVAYLLWDFNRDHISIIKILAFGLASLLVIPVYKTVQKGLSNVESVDIATLLNGYSFLSTYFGFEEFFVSNFHGEFGLLTSFFILLITSTFITTKSINPKYAYMAAFSYMPLIIITYYNLHTATRYLFFIVPLFIIASIIGAYKFSIQLLKEMNISIGTNHKTAITVAIAFLCLMSFVNIGYAVDISTRTHGEAYQNQFYSPSHEFQADSRTANQYVATHKSEDDLVIAKHFQYYYFYADEEPGYWYRPGGHSFISDDDKKVVYMNRTKGLTDASEVRTAVENYSGAKVWVPISTKFGHVDNNNKLVEAVEGLRGEYEVERIEVGETDGPVVYKINKTE